MSSLEGALRAPGGTKHFSREDIMAVDPRRVADALAAGLAMVARGAAVAPVRGHIDFGDGAGTFLISGALTELDLLTVKVINVRPANAARGLERLQGSLAVFESSTGRLLATLDAKAATEARTAACSAVSLRHLAREDAKVLVIFGTGPQGKAHERALTAEHEFKEVRIVGHRDASAADALRGADVIVTATNSQTPLFAEAAVEDGVHLAMVGTGSHAAAEVAPSLLGRAGAIRVDHRPSCLAEAGEIVQAIAAGHLRAEAVRELGEVVLGQAPGRTSPDEITVYKSVGNGTQDAALAALLLGRQSK